MTMDLLLDLKLLVLISVANGTPVISKGIFGQRFTFPLDHGIRLPDGQPLLGPSKSVRGVVLSLLITTLISPILQIDWEIGLLIATMAMGGDLCSSFFKRRMKLPTSSMAIGLDQVPESLFPLVAFAALFPLSAAEIALVVSCFFVGELFVSRLLFGLGLRDRPY